MQLGIDTLLGSVDELAIFKYHDKLLFVPRRPSKRALPHRPLKHKISKFLPSWRTK
jgi:hypothetical protein